MRFGLGAAGAHRVDKAASVGDLHVAGNDVIACALVVDHRAAEAVRAIALRRLLSRIRST